jgi:hypothetical protein
VAAAVVAAADRQRRAPLAGEVVEQRGLPDAGGAEQHGRATRREPVLQSRDPGAVDDADREHRHGSSERRPDVERLRRRVVAQVGLGEHDQRVGLRVGREREEALQPAHVQIAVQRPDDERQVDVRGQHLRLAAIVAAGAGDPALAREQRVDDARLRVGGDPVADGGKVGRGRGGVGHPPGRGAGPRAGGGQQLQPATVGGGDACCDQIGAPERRKRGVEARGPAKVIQ